MCCCFWLIGYMILVVCYMLVFITGFAVYAGALAIYALTYSFRYGWNLFRARKSPDWAFQRRDFPRFNHQNAMAAATGVTEIVISFATLAGVIWFFSLINS